MWQRESRRSGEGRKKRTLFSSLLLRAEILRSIGFNEDWLHSRLQSSSLLRMTDGGKYDVAVYDVIKAERLWRQEWDWLLRIVIFNVLI